MNNINKYCIIPDDPCNTDTITLSGCTLNVSSINFMYFGSAPIGTAIQFEPVINGVVGIVTYLWTIGDTTILKNIIDSDGNSGFTNEKFAVGYVYYPYPLQTIINITCKVTDSIGCSSTKRCQFNAQLDEGNLTYNIFMDCSNSIIGDSPSFVILDITNTTADIYLTGTEDNCTMDIIVRLGTITGTIILTSLGRIWSAYPFNLSGLLATTEYTVIINHHNPDGSINSVNNSFTTT